MASRSLLWPDPRVKPPFGAAEVDWGHPLSSGVSGIWLFNEGGGVPINAVNGRKEALVGAPPQLNYAPGIAFDFNQTVTQYVSVGGSIPSGSFSLFAIALRAEDTPTSGKTKVEELMATYPNSGSGIEVVLGNGFGLAADKNKARVSLFGGGSVTEAWQDGSRSTGSNPFDTAITTNAWVTLSTSATGTAAGTGHLFGAQPPTGDVFLLRGRIAVVYEWALALSPQQHAWLHAEPYAMLRPIVRRRYFVPAGAVALSLADTAALGLQEAAGVTAGFRLSDVAALGLNEADALLATLTAADAVALGVLDTEALLARLTLADLSAMGLMDAASILGGMTVSDAVALGIIDREMILAQIPLADAAALGLDDVLLLHALLTDLSDALGVGIQESVSVAQAMALALSDTFGLTGIEALTLGVSAVLADTVALNAAETLDLLSTFTMPDGTALTASDALSLLARFSVGDTAALALQDSVTVNALLSLADSCGLGVAEAVTVTAGILLADSCGLTLAEVLDILEALAPALLLFDRPVRLLGGDDRRVALVGGDNRQAALVGGDDRRVALVGGPPRP